MVRSDLRSEVEIWPFCACTLKICNITLIIYYRNSSVVVDLLWDMHIPRSTERISSLKSCQKITQQNIGDIL